MKSFFLLPDKIAQIVEERGFFVYQYISKKELFFSIKKDFLEVLEKFRWGLLTIIIISYAVSENIITVLISLGCAYALISLYLLGKLFWRTQYFLYLNNIIFCKKLLITGKSVFSYSDEKLQKTLLLYEQIFDEFLTEKSVLKKKIQHKFSDLKKKDTHLFKKIIRNDNFSRQQFKDNDRNELQIKVLASMAMLIYSVSIFVFYYLGIAIISIVFYIFSFFLSFYLLLKDYPELKVKKYSEEIDISLQRIDRFQNILSQELSSFSDGNISDLEKIVEEKILKFNTEVQKVFNKQSGLARFIEKNFKKNIIDFVAFQNYVLKKLKQPMIEMQDLLKSFLRKTKKELKNISTLKKNNFDEKMLARLEQKEFYLKTMEKKMKQQIEKLNYLNDVIK